MKELLYRIKIRIRTKIQDPNKKKNKKNEIKKEKRPFEFRRAFCLLRFFYVLLFGSWILFLGSLPLTSSSSICSQQDFPLFFHIRYLRYKKDGKLLSPNITWPTMCNLNGLSTQKSGKQNRKYACSKKNLIHWGYLEIRI